MQLGVLACVGLLYLLQGRIALLHGESITDQASPRTPTQRTFQPQEAVQPQRNQTILQADKGVSHCSRAWFR